MAPFGPRETLPIGELEHKVFPRCRMRLAKETSLKSEDTERLINQGWFRRSQDRDWPCLLLLQM